MKCIRTVVLTLACLLVASAAVSERPQKAKARKCPADKIVIGGHDIARILVMLGARREIGASDEQLRGYGSHFERSDPNRDGKQTRAEYVDGGSYMTPQARAGIFGATDNNADGIVTKVEYVLNRAITDEAKAIVQRTDADKNGKVNRAEFVRGSPIKDKSLAGAVYDALDTSGDGVITIPEYLRVWGRWARPNYKAQEKVLAARMAKLGAKSGKPKPGGKPSAPGDAGIESLFKLADRDGDGKLTKAELRRLVKAGDVDGDEALSLKEMIDMQRKSGARGGKPLADLKPGRSGKPSGGPPSVEQVFKIMDRDKDGKLTKTEFRGPARVFTDADKNRDGVVTRAELTALRGRTGPPSR